MKVVRKSGVEVKLDIVEILQARIADFEERGCETPLDDFIRNQQVTTLRAIHEEILNMSTTRVIDNRKVLLTAHS